MMITVLKSKIHRARITKADLHYEGSISIDKGLLDAAGFIPFERVEVYNVSNGERFATYAIEGNSGEICLNGAAAWKGRPGDIVIIASYAMVEMGTPVKPKVILLNEHNVIQEVR